MEIKNKLNQSNYTFAILRTALFTTGLAGLMVVANPAFAASTCKGLENSVCVGTTSCGWVEGYQRKDGRNVKSFCRTKAVSKKAVSKKAVSKKAVSKKASSEKNN